MKKIFACMIMLVFGLLGTPTVLAQDGGGRSRQQPDPCAGIKLISTQELPAETQGSIVVRFRLTYRCTDAGRVSVIGRGLPDGVSVIRTENDDQGWYISLAGTFKPGTYPVRFNVYQGGKLAGSLIFDLKVTNSP